MSTYTLPPDGRLIDCDEATRDVLGDVFAAGADTIVIPVARLAPDFFRLSTGLAGAVLQKFANYQISVIVLGDISGPLAASAPLRDFVRESNRGTAVRFLDALPEG